MIKLNKTIHKKHGLSYSRLNNILAMMKQRCYNHNAPNYNDYGGRGIRICEEWLSSLKSFVEWAELNGYDENLTIERVNVDGDYCPENCKWITIQDQQWNKRNTTHITIDGNTKTIKEWADEYNLKPYNIRYRISMGYSGKDLIKPVVNRKADKQSGEMYVKWNDHDNRWIVVIKGKYIGGSVDLNRAIEIKNEYLERTID